MYHANLTCFLPVFALSPLIPLLHSLIHKFWQVISGSQADTEKAIEAAAEAFKTFSRTTLEQVSGVCTGVTSRAYVGLYQLFAGTC